MRAMSLRALICALGLAVAVAPAYAQEQRGSIEGVVKDASGAVLAGVTVEATGPTQASFSAVTDAAGTYRFPALPPGRYDLAANLSGFNAGRAAKVEVLLGQLKKVDFTLTVAGVAETLQVTAESPLIDVRQSTKSYSIREELLEKLPRGRDFSSVVTQAPGANSESRYGGGISIDGSSSGENKYIIDGVETTELVGGRQGKALITDFIEEIQVKSSGYPAEYGGATGGVINVITKSGTNQFSGAASTYFSGDSLEGKRRPTLRLQLANADLSEYITFPEDSWTRWEPGFGVGGPIARDRAWFFGSYQPALTSTDRTVTLLADGSRLTRTEDVKVHYFSGNVTSQFNAATHIRVATNFNPSKTKGLLPSLDGSDALGTLYDIDTIRDNYTVSANLDYVASSRLFFGLRGGYFFSDLHTEGIPQGPRYIFNTSNIGMAGVPANLQRTTGFNDPLTNTETRKDELTRLQFQADTTYYGTFGGQHQIKGGVSIDRPANSVDGGETGHRVQLFWGRSFSGQRGTFGYYRVRSNGLKPQLGFLRAGDVTSNNVGLFIQDAWTIADRLTLNLGIRTENEHVPSFTTEGGISSDAVKWNFSDKLAPRVGVAYDIKGDGRWKVYGSWGLFYDIMKLELPRGSFGGEHWLEYWFTLDQADWTTLSRSGCPPACPGRLILGPVDFRHPSNAPGENTIDPELDPMRLQEAVVGFEHELSPVIGLSVRYVHKQIDKGIEDVGALDAQQNEIYKIANPGFGTAASFFPAGSTQSMVFPKAVRDYDGVEFIARKRLSDNWSGVVSYLWSRLQGNYTGLAQADEPGRHSPNVGRVFDYPLMMFDERGQPVFGRLPTDRPHQLKAQFLYDFPIGTSVGLGQYIGTGIPVTREAAFIEGNNFPVQYNGRLSDGRNPVYSQTDIYLQHEFRLTGNNRVTVSFNVLNLFDQETDVDKFRTQLATGFAVPVSEVQFYSGIDTDAIIRSSRIPIDPRFLQPNVFQGARSMRLGFSWRF